MTCREVLEDFELSYFGEYHHVLFELMSWRIKAIKIKKYIFLSLVDYIHHIQIFVFQKALLYCTNEVSNESVSNQLFLVMLVGDFVVAFFAELH